MLAPCCPLPTENDASVPVVYATPVQVIIKEAQLGFDAERTVAILPFR